MAARPATKIINDLAGLSSTFSALAGFNGQPTRQTQGRRPSEGVEEKLVACRKDNPKRNVGDSNGRLT
jgi:hypothetical protein